MYFRASGRRIAVDVDSWHLPIPTSEILNRLRQSGFALREINMSKLALSCVERSVYRRGVAFSEAPRAFDCSSFVKWLYAERGIWIPRRCLHQFSAGLPVEDHEIISGDLVFLSGSIRPPIGTLYAQASHVGIVTDHGLVVHAAPDVQSGVAAKNFELEGCILVRGASHRTAGTRNSYARHSSHLEIETSDDVAGIS